MSMQACVARRSSWTLHRRRYTTNNVQSSRKVSPLTVGATLGLGALVSYYFFFPDTSRGAPTSKHEKLSPSHFTPCAIVSSEACGPNSRLISISIPSNSLPASGERPFSPIWSVFVKDDDIQVERPYTPLEGVDEQGRMRFWIKKYTHGEVGRWLHSKKVGDEIEIRGPLQTWPWKEDDAWDEVVMISGGTGIAPFYQLFHQVISRANSSRTRFTLVHSSRSPSELPPSEILKPLASYASANPDRFRMRLFVDATDSASSEYPNLQIGRIDRTALLSSIESHESVSRSWSRLLTPFKSPTDIRRTLFLVCGPEPMIGAIAGPYGRNFSQGPVGGILAEIGATSNQVYKL